MAPETFRRFPPPMPEAERQAKLKAALERIPADQRHQAIRAAADKAILPFLHWNACRHCRKPKASKPGHLQAT